MQETGCGPIKVLCWHLQGGTEEGHENLFGIVRRPDRDLD
jgi:hypothetical protein